METGNLEYLKNVLSNDFQKQFLTQVSGISLLEQKKSIMFSKNIMPCVIFLV